MKLDDVDVAEAHLKGLSPGKVKVINRGPVGRIVMQKETRSHERA